MFRLSISGTQTTSTSRGAFAYLDWSYVFSEIHGTLMHADCVNFGNSIAYLHWDFEIPTWNFELSVDVTDELAKYCVGINCFVTSFS